ncbi:ribonuclease H-like domain-containing protein [Tanacetum coccineum]
MSAPKFVDSHNMVVFLAKPIESDGFEQILDFLNANPIKYALMLQALVDRKKVITTETNVRRDLHLEDAEGIECLPNADIFEQLALIGAKSTVWNEFSNTMASAKICLATNQKFNFSKYIFESMVKNMDSSVKFIMYPRFVQVFLDKQVGDMSTHDENFVTPSHTKKVFGNIKRVGKGFSRAVTSLFPTIMVQAQEEIDEEPIADEAANEENVPTQSNDPPLSRVNTLGSGEDRQKLKELMDHCTKLSDRVLDLETTKTAQAKEIARLKKRVKKLERKRKSKTPWMKRLLKVSRSAQVVSSEDEEQSEKVIEEVVSTAEVSDAAIITTEEITLAQALAELRSAKPKIVVQEPVQSTTTTAPSTIPKAKIITFRDPGESTQRPTLTPTPSNIKDKGKAKMIEPKKPLKMKEQIRLDKELSFKLQAKEEEQARLAREKAEKVKEANIS